MTVVIFNVVARDTLLISDYVYFGYIYRLGITLRLVIILYRSRIFYIVVDYRNGNFVLVFLASLIGFLKTVSFSTILGPIKLIIKSKSADVILIKFRNCPFTS